MDSKKHITAKSVLTNTGLYLGVFLLTLGVLWGLLALVAQIPNEKLRENAQKSADYFMKHRAFERTWGEHLCGIQDNYADVILMNVCWYMGVNNHKSPVLNTYYYENLVPDHEVQYLETNTNTGFQKALEDITPNTDYSRYWHGTAIFIRPLLLITDVQGIRLILFCMILLLLAINLLLLIARRQYSASALLLLSVLGVQIWGIRLALEYLPGFLVLFLMLPFFILFEKKGGRTLTVLSIITGTLLTFFDFLTVETITLLVPLMIVFLIREQEGRFGSLRDNLILIVRCGLAWGSAYLATFLAKWSLASIFTGENKFSLAVESAGVRTYGDANGFSTLDLIFNAPSANLSTLFLGTSRLSRGNVVLGIIGTIFAFTIVVYLLHGKTFHRDFTITMTLLSALVFLRYMVLSNHSYLHEFFTFRAQMSVIFAILAIAWVHIDFSILCKKGGRR